MDEAAIARLVLGYLKEEGCRGAYKDFFKASRNLQTSKFSSSKYVPTRFVGLTLRDILREYYEIYQTVQGWLEATNYYREPHSNTSLTHQLLYLLNNKRQLSRASTPCFRSPRESHFGEASPVYTDHVSDVEATPVHKLPGNIQYESDESNISQIPRKRNRSRISDDFPSSSATEKERSTEVFFDTEMLAQTLLENKDLPEKIAQTINKVTEKKHRYSTELNETIQSVVKETAQDPIFDQILEEIIGSATVVDSNRHPEIQSTKNSHIQHESLDNSQKRLQKKLDSHENSETPVQEKTDKRVEEQNAEAIQCIIESSKTQTETQSQQQVTYNGKNDVIVFDGTLDKYILSNACSIPAPVQQQQTPFVLNTNGGLLMVPSTMPPTIAQATGNQYYILNKPPLLNCFVPQSTVLTETDILAMPTVILNDDKSASKSSKKRKTQPRLQPKQQIDISTTADLSEFLTLNKRQDERKNDVKNNTKVETNKKMNTSKEKETASLFSMTNEKASIDSQSTSDMSSILPDCNKASKPKDVPILTPTHTTNSKKTTPKSGSHVRNLNFSTPPKITSSGKKAIRDKHSTQNASDSKKQAAKMLFKKDDNTSISDKKREEKPWDANLRSFLPKPVTPNPKTRRRVRSTKKTPENAKDTLNKTEQDGALIEAALKTPVKSDVKEDIEENSEERGDSEIKDNSSKPSNKECNVVIGDNNDEKKHLKDVAFEGHKTVLSPSKLNANKRNIVTNNTVSENDEKFVTPEVIHDAITYPIKANRNITPMLETPMKAPVPKTPGLGTPVDFNISSLSNFTPVAKMLEANLTGFDINLPTPNIPITPSFPPFTPTVDLMSPFSNRPTDYSTSSSYYQPSDNEQNKSLEAQLLEVEKKTPSDEKGNDINAIQHLNIFNKNVIGKKNLNLVKRTETNCSSSSNSSSSSSSDSSEDDDDSSLTWMEKESNDTIICKKRSMETPRKSYSLRNRSISCKSMTPIAYTDKESSLTEDPTSINVTKSVKSGNKVSKKGIVSKSVAVDKISDKTKQTIVYAGREGVMKELEEKRQRTINKFKNNEIFPADKQKKSGRFIKIKPLANVTHQRKRARKSDSPKKNVAKNYPNSLLNTLRKDLADSDGETEDDISLRLSVSDDEEKVQQATDKRLKILEKTDKSASDVEAQTLIEGLKERGIHLMHNKSTKNDTSGSKSSLNSSESGENLENNVTVLNSSTGQQKTVGPLLDYPLRDGLDTCLITEEIHLTFNESDVKNRVVENNNQNDKLENFRARLYIEEIDKEVDIEFKLSDFHVLLDINSSGDNDEIVDLNTYQKKKSVNSEDRETDSSLKQDVEGNLRESQSPPSSKKRKYQDDAENAHKEKKCKKLLNKINVDSFLNNIHGNK